MEQIPNIPRFITPNIRREKGEIERVSIAVFKVKSIQ